MSNISLRQLKALHDVNAAERAWLKTIDSESEESEALWNELSRAVALRAEIQSEEERELSERIYETLSLAYERLFCGERR